MAEYSQKWHNGTSRGRSTETSDGLAAIQAQLNNLGREIKKVNENFYAAQVGWYYQRNNANPSFQERRQSMEDTLSKFMSESAKRHEENFNLIKEIQASTDSAIRNQGASIKTLEIQIRQISKSISTTIEADSNSIRRIGSNQYAVSTGQNSTLLYKSRQMTVPFLSRLDNHYYDEEGNYGPKFMEAYGASHINNAIPRKEKDPGMKDKMVFKGDNVVGAFMNVPIFVGTFFVVTDFLVLEDMDAYHDEGMGNFIVGEPFLREVGIKARRFNGMITIYNGDNEVTYQMMRSTPH
ncbi:hypothetical protein Tco_1075936 [Tanacetum coccineum]